MKKIHVLFSALVVAFTVGVGCLNPPAPGPPPPPSPPNPTDPSDDEDPDALLDAGAPVCLTACVRLRRLGCPEGSPRGGDGCVGTCLNSIAKQTVDLKPACIASAKTVTAIRACGTVDCVR